MDTFLTALFTLFISFGASADISPNIHTVVTGNSLGQPVVLIHGNGMDLESFAPILEQMNQHYLVIRYDQRGSGRTRYQGVDFSIESMILDLDVALSDVPLNQKVHLVGHSFGARIAVAYANRHRDRIQSITIEDMDMMARQPVSADKCRALAQSMRELNRVYSSEQQLWTSIQQYYGPNPSQLDRFIVERLPDGKIRLVENPYAPYAWGCVANSLDLTGQLVEFPGRIQLFQADLSMTAMDPNWVSKLQSLRPTRLVNFPGSHHVIHIFDPVGFLKELFTGLSN